MKKLIFIISFSFLLVMACAKKSKLVISKNTPTEDKAEVYRLALVSLNITKTDNGYLVSLPNSRIVNASIKSEDLRPDKWNDNDFICFVLDKDKSILDTLIIVQPLHPRYEYPNDDGTIGSKVIELNQNEVLLRFSYNVKMKFLRIVKVEKNNKLIILNTIELL